MPEDIHTGHVGLLIAVRVDPLRALTGTFSDRGAGLAQFFPFQYRCEPGPDVAGGCSGKNSLTRYVSARRERMDTWKSDVYINTEMEKRQQELTCCLVQKA
jgi:hypothetical protein